jgi:hypothetical protein
MRSRPRIVSAWRRSVVRRLGRVSGNSRDAKYGPRAVERGGSLTALFHGIKKPGSDGSQGGKGLLSLPGAIGSN